MSNKRFLAILAKNEIARDIADAQLSGVISSSAAYFTISRLTEIETFLGEGNQPSVGSIYTNNKQENRKFTI